MKHAFHFLLIFLFCFALVSCGGGDEAVQPTTDPIDNGGGNNGGNNGGDNGGNNGGNNGGDNGGNNGGNNGGDNGGDSTTVDPNPQDGAINPIPESFTQKVVIEEATGNWCGWCPMGTAMMDKYIELYPSRVYGVAIHGGSPTEPMLNQGLIDYLGRLYNLTGYPGGLVNRRAAQASNELFMLPEEWPGVIENQLAKNTNSVGIALESNINEAEAIATVQVHVGFGKNVDTSIDYRILIYLTEDSIIAPQQNYLSRDTRFKNTDFHKYYEAPSVIQEFVHNHVAKRAFTTLDGEEIGAENVGEFKKFKKQFQINLTRNDNLSEMHVVAVVLRDGSKPYVLNAQKVKLGETQNWD